MYISELQLQGFKSFAHKTDVSFDRGITAIVGPNGCGKSNIVDALRWVLGEQRPTLLRSSSMANVIFNGTAQKKALGMAEVSLTFVNNRGLLPTEYHEVTISRQLYRSGESKYLINGTECRLKDIMELFMDTGMSSDAYSVIELKMVEEILTNKNNDRRRLFEEAAGVTGYKEKRKKTLRKLDSTQENLQRVEDLLAEIRKKVRSLERQAEKARKAKKYRKELSRLDKALNRHKFQNIQDELSPLKERINNADTEKKEILSDVEELESAEENAREALKQKERQEADAQRRVNQLASTVREAKTGLQITREKINTEKNVIDEYNDDIKQAGQDLKELREHHQTYKQQLEHYDKELEKANRNLEDSKQTYRSVQEKYREVRESLDETEQVLDEAHRALNELQTKRIRIESRLESNADEIERNEDERGELRKQVERLQTDKENLADELDHLRETQSECGQELREAREQREQLSRRKNELKDQIRDHQSRLDSLQSEIELLQEIAQSNEAFPGSVKFLTENHATDFGLLKVVSNVLSTDEEHAVALEAVLGNALNFVIVQSLEDASRAADILKENDWGQATFIPLDELNEPFEAHPDSLARQVETTAKFQPVTQILLGRAVMVDSLSAARSDYDTSITAVTKEGEVVTNRHFLQSGSTARNAGMRVGLKDKIEKLEQKAATVTKKFDEATETLQEVQETYRQIDLNRLEEKVQASRKKVREKEDLANSYKSKIQIYRSNIEELKKRTDKLTEAKEFSREALEELGPQRKELQATIKKRSQQQSTQKATIEELEEERSIAQSRFNEARLKHQQLQNKVGNHRRDIRRAEEGIKNLKNRLETRSAKKNEAQGRITAHQSAIEELEKTLSDAAEKKESADENLAEEKQASARQRGKINQVEDDLKEVRRRKEVNMELVHHLSMAKEKLEMQAGNISDHIWETYELLMDQIEATLPDDTTPDESRERLSWLRQKLNRVGEVNELAVEEFEEEKERLDFYEEQIEDLTTARAELEETIAEINKTATERFNKTFAQIRTNFKNVFHTLFNENDFCDLVIDEQAEDPLEAAIDIEANPRGKRPSTLNQLSTGEKTLTAIALLFAIYLVKPSPFCVLDEVDAPLDDTNIERFAAMIKRFSKNTQFIIITHNKKTMSKAEMMYGVTMPETGISRLVGVQMNEVVEA